MEEQRDVLAPRIFFDGKVLLEREGEPDAAGRAYNISLRGVFVRMEEPLPLDVALTAHFALPDGQAVVAEATVVRVCDGQSLEPRGIALRFDRLLEDGASRLQAFVEESQRPARGETLRLVFEQLGTPVSVRAHADWDDVVAVDAELPFLQLGSGVQLTQDGATAPRSGAIRWVSIHVDPDTGIPRLNVGIEIVDDEPVGEVDEEHDPVLSDDYAQHSQARDRELRQAREGESES